MGSKNRDRYMPEDWRASAETVDRMLADGWIVMAKCGLCNVLLNVDLKLVRRLKGGDFSLWNKTAPCKVVGCSGVAHFVGNPPRVGRAVQIVLIA